MSYYVNTAKVSKVTIEGEDVTNRVIQWTASDQTLYNNGAMVTTGELVLGRTTDMNQVVDYPKLAYRRGEKVIVTVNKESGGEVRHPRGLLYVIGSTYDPEAGTETLDLGCKLALAALNDDVTNIKDLAPIPLDPARDDFQSVSGSFASGGQYMFMDNTGAIQTGSFFEGNSWGQVSNNWTSVFGVTTSQVSPLQGAEAIPDAIELSYQYPEGIVTEDNTGRIDVDETKSEYFLQYPGTVYVRTFDPSNGVPGGIQIEEPNPGYTNPCGNTGSDPANGGQDKPSSCSDGFTTEKSTITIPATSVDRSESHYNGLGGQVTYRYSETRGPALELNSQYFADAYASCRYTYATACNPGGDCPLVGTETILQTYQEEFNEFDDFGTLIRKTTDSYKNVLAAAQPFNWRSGTVNGAPKSFSPLTYTEMYLDQRVIVDYSKQENQNVEVTTTYSSNAQSGSGLGITDGEFDGAVTQLTAAKQIPNFNGQYTNLSTGTNGNGQGMVVDVTASGNGTAKGIRLMDVNYPNENSSFTVVRRNVPVFGGAGTGMTVDYEVERYAVFEDDRIQYKTRFIEFSVNTGGSGYRKGDNVRNAQPGSGELVEIEWEITGVTTGVATADVKIAGTNYRAGDQVWVTSSALVAAGATSAAGQGNLVFEVKGTVSGGGTDDLSPGIASVNVTRAPRLIQGVYRGLPIGGGEGEGATGDVYVVASSAVQDLVRTKKSDRKDGLQYSQGANFDGKNFRAYEGSGEGLVLKIRWDRGVPSDFIPGAYQDVVRDGPNVVAIINPGSGYNPGDTVVVRARDLAEEYFWVDPTGDDTEFEVTNVTGTTVELNITNGGSGYGVGDEIYVHERDLKNAGATNNNDIGNLRAKVDSIAKGVGANAVSINAISGRMTRQISKSTTISTLPVAPDTVNSPTTQTKSETSTVVLRNDRYLNDPGEAGPYIAEESVPVPFLFTNIDQVNSAVADYEYYLRSFILGDALGINIVEDLTDQILDNWYPGAGFRYADPNTGQILALRADACTWGITPTEAGVAINGIFCGISNGNLTVPDNLVGNTPPTPIDNGGGGEDPDVDPPEVPVEPPVVDGEDGVNQGDFSMVVNVYVSASVAVQFDLLASAAGPVEPVQTRFSVTPAIYLDGQIVTAGSTLGTTAGGGIPYSYKGSLLTQDAEIIEADIFS